MECMEKTCSKPLIGTSPPSINIVFQKMDFRNWEWEKSWVYENFSFWHFFEKNVSFFEHRSTRCLLAWFKKRVKTVIFMNFHQIPEFWGSNHLEIPQHFFGYAVGGGRNFFHIIIVILSPSLVFVISLWIHNGFCSFLDWENEEHETSLKNLRIKRKLLKTENNTTWRAHLKKGCLATYLPLKFMHLHEDMETS